MKMNFTEIDSHSKAIKFFEDGQLEKLFLLPLQFGGQDDPDNTLYVPLGIANIKDSIDNNIIAKLVDEGKVTRYKATPEYLTESFIPNSITIRAFDPGEFSTTIEIWK